MNDEDCYPDNASVSCLCGDGKVEGADEVCDDKNSSNGDGCSSSCSVEDGYSCCLTQYERTGEEAETEIQAYNTSLTLDNTKRCPEGYFVTAVSGQNGNPYKLGLHCSQISSDGTLTGEETIVDNYTSHYSTSTKVSCPQNSFHPNLMVSAEVSHPYAEMFLRVQFNCLNIFSIAEETLTDDDKIETKTDFIGELGSNSSTTKKSCPDHYAIVGMKYHLISADENADINAIQWICEEIKSTKCDTTSPTYCHN